MQTVLLVLLVVLVVVVDWVLLMVVLLEFEVLVLVHSLVVEWRICVVFLSGHFFVFAFRRRSECSNLPIVLVL